MSDARKKIIVALDVGSFDAACGLVDRLRNDIDIFKVGSQLFTANGPEIVKYIQKAGKKVFLDLKFHDIPNTVANAVQAAVGLREGSSSIFMCTLHTVGGEEMLKRAVEAAREASKKFEVSKPLLLGITVLTSDAKTDNIHDLVLARARLAKECGLDGVVASSHEVGVLRREIGDDLIIVTPGIRLAGSDAGDQKRVATPKEAIDAGSSYLVIGRPIVKADDPAQAARDIINEIDS